MGNVEHPQSYFYTGFANITINEKNKIDLSLKGGRRKFLNDIKISQKTAYFKEIYLLRGFSRVIVVIISNFLYLAKTRSRLIRNDTAIICFNIFSVVQKNILVLAPFSLGGFSLLESKCWRFCSHPYCAII